MPDSGIDTKDLLDDGTLDPLADVPVTDDTPSDIVDNPVVTPTPEPVTQSFGDLPFKSSEEIVSAYKNLQSAYANDRIRMTELSTHLQNIAPMLKEIQISKGRTEVEAEDDVAKSLAAFIESGPNKTFASFLEKNLTKHLDPAIKPLLEKVTRLEERENRREQEGVIDRFISAHKDLTTQDEQALVDIIRSTPRISKMPDLSDRLEAALERFIARDPSGYASRSVVPTNTVVISDPALADAKKGASTLGGKAGGKGPTPAKDEFDGVLDRDRDERGRWV